MSNRLKESFNVQLKYESFFTGGKIQFTKNGKNILSSCGKLLKIFDVENGKIIDTIGEQEEGEEITSFVFGDDDDTLVIAYINGILRQYSLSSKIIKRTWKSLHIGVVSCMAFDSTTTLLATGGSDSRLKIWHVIEKYCTHNLKGAQGVFSKVCFKKIGSEWFVFGAADDYKLHFWNLNTNKHVAALEGHYSTVTDIVFLPTENMVMSCGRDKVVLLWDFVNCKLLKTIPVYETIESIILAPESLELGGINRKTDDTFFITAGDKGILRIWSLKTSQCVYSQENSAIVQPEESSHVGLVIAQASYIPALEAITVTTFDHNIILYNLKDFSLRKQFIGYNDEILSIKFMGVDDKYLAVATNSSEIKMFHAENFSCIPLKGHTDIVLSLDVFQRHKNILVSGSKDRNTKVWIMDQDFKSVECEYTGYGHTHSVSAVACARGKSKFFVSGSQDTTLKLWNIPKKKPLAALKLSLTPIYTVKAHDKNINFVDISANDKLVATGSQDHTAKIWDASDLTLLGILRGHSKGIWCVNFSPVDLVAATSSADGTIRLWSISDFSTIKVIEGHEAPVLQVIFISQGTQLLSSASDGNIKLWEIKNSICVKTLSEHKAVKIWTIDISSDEQFLVSGSDDSDIIIWKDVTAEEKEKDLAEKEKFLAQSQVLSTLVHEEQWTRALSLAITLDRPYQSYNIIDKIYCQEDGEKAMETVFNNLRQDQKDMLLKYISDWMTHERTYYYSVLILNLYFQTFDIEDMLAMASVSSYVRDILPYLEMHFKRKQKRCQDMQLLNFIQYQLKLSGNVESLSEVRRQD